MCGFESLEEETKRGKSCVCHSLTVERGNGSVETGDVIEENILHGGGGLFSFSSLVL